MYIFKRNFSAVRISFMLCSLSCMFRVMCADFGDWLSIRVDWSKHAFFQSYMFSIHAYK